MFFLPRLPTSARRSLPHHFVEHRGILGREALPEVLDLAFAGLDHALGAGDRVLERALARDLLVEVALSAGLEGLFGEGARVEQFLEQRLRRSRARTVSRRIFWRSSMPG